MSTFSDCCTIYLNRDCPRNCSFCANKKSIPSLSGEQWCIAFDKLRMIFDTKFFLILGIEPLMLDINDLYKIVDYFKENPNLEYAFYTTAPESYLGKLQLLFDRGLRNVSCGVDTLPWLPGPLQSKAKSAIKIFDLAYKQPGVTEIHALITIQKYNIHLIRDIIEFLYARYPEKLHIGLNYIEHGDGDDFDFAPEDCPESFSESDEKLLRSFSNSAKAIYADFSNIIQTPYEYIKDYKQAITLNRPCNMVIPCIEADGSLRKCGYRTGNFNINILDADIFVRNLYKDAVKVCKGCYWAYPYIVSTNNELVDYRSEVWRNKYDRK